MLYIIYRNLKFTIYDKNSKDLLKMDILKFPSGRIYLNDIIFRLQVCNLESTISRWVSQILDRTYYNSRQNALLPTSYEAK